MRTVHDILQSAVGFDWDSGNSQKSRLRHSLEPSEAERVFLGEPLLLLEDVQHSQDECRFHALGHTQAGRLLAVAFTMREDKIRVISARDMSRKERKIYEEA